MIGSLRGELLDRADDELLVEVSGVGYRVSVTPATAGGIGALATLDGDLDLLVRDADRDSRRRPVARLGDPLRALSAGAASRARRR